MNSVFRPNGGFLAEVDPFAPRRIIVGMFAFAANHRLIGPLWQSRWCHCGRTEFCDCLVCPEFPMKQSLLRSCSSSFRAGPLHSEYLTGQ